MNDEAAGVGVVVIGRNEGERLRRCLESLPRGLPVVYVDSGSVDGSPALAKEAGASVLVLDPARPYSAAPGRNEGLARLRELYPQLELAQLMDGDCLLAPEWLGSALAAIHADPKLAVVCGRRRELFPDASIYNRLCDMEWDGGVGDVKEFGGDALVRVAALRQAGGYRASMIAGEEPELSFRLRAGGWKIQRIGAEMTAHDAAIHRFGQWWKRQVRAGYAYGLCYALHGRSPERFRAREIRSIVVWAAALPLAVVLLVAIRPALALLPFALYPLQYVRIRDMRLRRGAPIRHARLDAAFCLVGKFAQLVGLLRFLRDRIRGGPETLIEYK